MKYETIDYFHKIQSISRIRFELEIWFNFVKKNSKNTFVSYDLIFHVSIQFSFFTFVHAIKVNFHCAIRKDYWSDFVKFSCHLKSLHELKTHYLPIFMFSSYFNVINCQSRLSCKERIMHCHQNIARTIFFSIKPTS